MNLRPLRQREAPSITLTPLIDVVFLLLIFFMVSATFRQETELELELPQAAREASAERERPLEVAIDAHGRIFVAGGQVEPPTLAVLVAALRDVAAGRTDQPLLLRADGTAPHRLVVRVLDAAGQAGLSRIAIAAETLENGS